MKIFSEGRFVNFNDCLGIGTKKNKTNAMKTLLLIGILFLTSISLFAQKRLPQLYKLPKAVVATDYIPKTIIIKVKPQFRKFCDKSGVIQQDLAVALSKIKISSISKTYPNQKPPLMEKSISGNKLVDLSTIYQITYSENFSIEDAINELLKSNTLEYAEPHFLPKTMYTPNDPMQSSQYSLSIMSVYQAWDICKGDTTVIIGISDTGTDIDHPDLVNSIKYNYDDPIDGIDNDNDGFIDNYRGWDLGENDNNPQVNKSNHGAWVSGIAAATVDNGIGVCGVGFNSKIMPCKIDDSTGVLVMAYESIVYLADHGCSIINCSWGSPGGQGQYGQDIINYAVINNNCLVVAASGNSNQEEYYYPASYDNVLSVGATNSADVRWNGNTTSGTTYNDKVDICAPGESIYTADNGGGYIKTWGGTSFASPNVAGSAAIVKARYPNFIGLQVGEQLKVTADIVDTLSANSAYKGKLGSGRVNLYRAVTEFKKSSVYIKNVTTIDNNDNVFLNGDTIRISAEMINYLAPTGSILATLSSPSSCATILNGSVSFGVLNTLGKNTNSLNPFKVVIHNVASYNEEIPFSITYQDTVFTKVYNFTIVVNKNYVDLISEKITTTITSVGRIGFVDDFKTQGKGYLYDGSYNLSGCIGLVVGCSSTQVSDAIFGVSGYSALDNDFGFMSPARLIAHPVFANHQVSGQMNDSIMGVNKVGVNVGYNIYAWDTLPNSKYLICEYYLKNMNTSVLSNLYIGLYSDWDIVDNTNNAAAYDDVNKMGYVYSLTSGIHYGGIKLLTSGSARCYSFDNNGDYGSLGIGDGFTSAEKWTALRTMRTSAGLFATPPTGNDVSQIISTGPFTLSPNDSVKVAFAIITGTSLIDIKNSAIAAQDKYTPPVHIGIDEKTASSNIHIYPNPSSDVVCIVFDDEIHSNCHYSLVDVLGNVVKSGTITNKTTNISLNSISAGVYNLQITTAQSKISQKLIIK